MAKRITFYIGLVLLPFIGYAIDWQMQNFKSSFSETFNLWPRIVFIILADIVLAAIILWLGKQTTKVHLSPAAALVFTILGLAVVCIPILILTPLPGTAPFFFSWTPIHRSIAGGFLLVTGMAALIWRPKPAAS